MAEEKCGRCDGALESVSPDWPTWMGEFNKERVDFDGEVFHASCFEEMAQEACMDCQEEDCDSCMYYAKTKEVFPDELVSESWGCKNCGERRVSHLHIEYELVTCQSCSSAYYI